MYENFKEIESLKNKKLTLFIDESQLIFKNTLKALLEKTESIIKLIQPKGVGVYFCTQVPLDILNRILAQLDLKIHYTLRGTIAKDRKEIKKSSLENYPTFYKLDSLNSQMAIVEALINPLNEKGTLPNLIHTYYMRAPYLIMDVLSEKEIQGILYNNFLLKKQYEQINLEEEKLNLFKPSKHKQRKKRNPFKKNKKAV